MDRRGTPSASSAAARSDPRCRRPSQKTGSAPSETTAICANASASGDGQTTQSGASRTRNGSTCTPSRTICSPVAPSVDSSGAPVRRAPDGLHHVSEVEPPDPEVQSSRRGRPRRARPSRRASPPQTASVHTCSPAHDRAVRSSSTRGLRSRTARPCSAFAPFERREHRLPVEDLPPAQRPARSRLTKP